MAKKMGLGRGLSAILPDVEEVVESVESAPAAAPAVPGDSVVQLPVGDIDPNRNQPRKKFDDYALLALADSIRHSGVISPILVARDDARYTIIAGERRWRAARLANLDTIPAIVREWDDVKRQEAALIENIQREDLNAIEIALAYEQLLDHEGMTQEKVSERVGKSRTAITNYLRLLRLPAQVQMALQKKEIDMGHARAILAVDSPSLQIKLFKDVQKYGYSVRKVEELAQQLKNGEDIELGNKKIVAKPALPEEFNVLKSRLSTFLNTKVQMTCSPKGKGKITIPFANEEELEHIMSVFDKMKQ